MDKFILIRNKIRATPYFQQRVYSLGFLVWILISEILTTLINPLWGMIGYGSVLIASLIISAFTTRLIWRRFFIIFSIIPLIRVIGLALPIGTLQIPIIYWYMIIGLLVYISAFIAGRLSGLNSSQIGWSWRLLPLQLLVGLTGILLGFIEYLILSPAPLVQILIIEEILLHAMILFIFTGLLEELVFRGLLQTVAMQAMGVFGLIFVAAIFSVLHIGYFSLWDTLFVFLVGLFFGWLVWKYRCLPGVSIAHGLTNICLYIVFPIIFAPTLTL